MNHELYNDKYQGYVMDIFRVNIVWVGSWFLVPVVVVVDSRM